MREGFSVSAIIEALQFLIPCTFCDELVAKGDGMAILAWIDHSTWGSKSSLTRQERHYSEMAACYETKKTSKPR